ncbi:MAG TPA: hypothetical protein VJ927_11020 [Actinomycetota bacterium]|nr:hypothetical protein [Actinomycetota bacterium]
MKRRSARAALVIALMVALLAAAGIASSAPVRVRATSGNEWDPSFRHVTTGTRIVWINPERLGRRHHLAAYGRGWSKDVVLESGERTGKRFRRVGSYKYRCRLHSQLQNGDCRGMCGVVHVTR